MNQTTCLDCHRLRIRDQSASVTTCPVNKDTNPRTKRAVPRNTREGGALRAALGEAAPAPPPPLAKECGFPAASGFLPMPCFYQFVTPDDRVTASTITSRSPVPACEPTR
jgi:hypothetical protein